MLDLDGTRVDMAAQISGAVNDALRQLGLGEVPETLVSGWIGHGTVELMARAYARASGWSVAAVRASRVTDRIVPIFLRCYAQRIDRTTESP